MSEVRRSRDKRAEDKAKARSKKHITGGLSGSAHDRRRQRRKESHAISIDGTVRAGPAT